MHAAADRSLASDQQQISIVGQIPYIPYDIGFQTNVLPPLPAMMLTTWARKRVPKGSFSWSTRDIYTHHHISDVLDLPCLCM